MPRIIGQAALITLGVIALTQAATYAVWGGMPDGYPLSIVIAGILIPLATCLPICIFLLTQRRVLARALDDLSHAHARLKEQSSRDPMTGLLHRQAFLERLDDQRRQAGAGAFLMIDIDRFKSINDSHGHAAGDEALRRVARALHDAARTCDMVSRFGGEEFCIFSPTPSLAHGAKFAERVRRSVEALHFAPAGDRHPLTVSIGVAHATAHVDVDHALSEADIALYEAKRRGRNAVATADRDAAPRCAQRDSAGAGSHIALQHSAA